VPGLDFGPQPVEQAPRPLVVRRDGAGLGHLGGVGIDGAVVEDRIPDKLLARQIAVGVLHQVDVLRRRRGPQQVIDQRLRLLDVASPPRSATAAAATAREAAAR
jgi:hypothetical protein